MEQPKQPFNKVPSLFSLDTKKDKTKPMSALTPRSNIEKEFDTPYNAWLKDQSPQSNDLMVNSIRPIIDSALTTYAGKNVAPSVRLQAKRMALEGLKTYDPSKSKLKTHMIWHMQGLKRVAGKANQILNVPERVRLDSSFINSSFNELSDSLGRDPNDNELSDHTGLSIKRIEKVRSFKPGMAEGAATMGISPEDGMSDPSSRIPGQESNSAWIGFVHDGLDGRSRLIMEHTLGMYGKKQLDNIALARKLKLTPARISQIRADIQAKMDGRERLGVI